MKLVVEVFATFVLIYWPAALIAVRAGLEEGEAVRARFASVIAPAILCLPALIGLLFYCKDWTFLWFSARTFLIAALVFSLIVAALLGFPRALFVSRPQVAGFTVRRNTVYYAGTPVAEADPATFECLSARLGRDRSHVFRGADILIGAASASFEVLGDSGYARDARRVYFLEKVIPGADPASFRRFEYDGQPSAFFRDAHSIYLHGKRIGLADVTTFQPLTQHYARDEQRVFHDGEVVQDADAASFEVLERTAGTLLSHDARDRHRRYLRGKAIA